MRIGRWTLKGQVKRKAIADANAEKAKVGKERDELREALNVLEEQLGTETRQYDSEDGTRPSRVKITAVTRVLRSVSSKKKGPRPHKHDSVDLDAEESVAGRVTRLLAHQAGPRASSLPKTCKMTRQSPQLAARPDKSAGSDMISGSQPPKHNLKALSLADALIAPTPEDSSVRRRMRETEWRHERDETRNRTQRSRDPTPPPSAGHGKHILLGRRP